MGEPESLADIAARQQGELNTLRQLSAAIFEHGAILTCFVCKRTREKTAEEMAAYLKSWPRCRGTKDNPHRPTPADVRVKEKPKP